MKQTGRWLLLLWLVLHLTIPAAASENLGTITLKLNVGELPVTNGSFTICRVGSKSSDGYRIREEFGGGFVREEDALSPHLAQWMERYAGENGVTKLMDADGNAVFPEVEEGLYLVLQRELTDGFYPIQSFLLTMPSNGRQNVTVNLEPLPRVMASPATGQDPAPILGLLGMGMSAVGLVLCGGDWKRKKR